MESDRQQFRVLTRHFFRRFFDNDLISPSSDLHGVLSKLAALLVIPIVFYSFRLLLTYGRPFWDYTELDTRSWPDKSTFVMLSLVVIGLVTVLEWDALHLDRRDCAALGSLPIRSRTIVWAKLAALGRFLAVCSIPLSLVGAGTFPIIMHAGWSSGVSAALWTVAGHAAATIAAAAFAFFAVLALHGMMHMLIGQRVLRRVSPLIQSVLTLGFVVALLVLPFIASSTSALKRGVSGAAGYAPQMWFMGIYETLSGQGDADWRLLAWRGAIALVVFVIVAILSSLVAYRRVLGTTIEAVQAGTSRRSWLAGLVEALGRIVARDSVERGFFSFSLLTLIRSPWHRVVLAAFVGGALALAIVMLDVAAVAPPGSQRVPFVVSHGLALQWVVLVILLSGVRAAAAAPAELKANWTLCLLEMGQQVRWMAGFRKAVLGAVVVPVVILMGGAAWLQFGWHVAWTHALICLIFAALVFEVLFRGFGNVPFACAFEGATGTVKVRWYVLGALFTTSVVTVTEVVEVLLRSTAGTVSLLAVSLAAVTTLRVMSRRELVSRGGLLFEHEAETTQALGLSA